MSVRQALLALLEQGPMYGYQLRSEFERRTGSTWPLNVGQVYTTLQRLERGDIDNPPIRYLVNLAEVYECRLVDVCEESWIEWTVFDTSAPEPPPKGHWLPERERGGR